MKMPPPDSGGIDSLQFPDFDLAGLFIQAQVAVVAALLDPAGSQGFGDGAAGFFPMGAVPELALATGEVSEKLGRGRHTTRHVELYDLGEETYVADTPGFSSFDTDQMEVILKENLQYAFPDFGKYIGSCRFDDCSHRKEPGCAVRDAVDSGDIEKTRYDSYLRLYEKSSQINLWELKK